MLTSLRIHNFKTFLNAEFKFQPRHLVIGKNNSGKTNLWQALRFLGATAQLGLQEAANKSVLGGVFEMLNWSLGSDIVQIACDCEHKTSTIWERYRYTLELRLHSGIPIDSPTDAGPRLVVQKESLEFAEGKQAYVNLLDSDGVDATVLDDSALGSSNPPQESQQAAPPDATMLSKLYSGRTNRLAVHFRNQLAAWGTFAMSPEAIRTGWKEPHLGSLDLAANGRNLANCLYHLKNFDEQGYRRVVEASKLLDPELEEVNFNTLAGEVPMPFVRRRNRRQALWISLSDGTLRWLAFAFLVEIARLTAVGVPHRPDLLFVIEEPGNGLYPGMMRKLLDMCDETPGAQFIFTSHSPYFINLFDSSRHSVTWLTRNRERTEIRTPGAPDESDPNRPLLAEQFSMDLLS